MADFPMTRAAAMALSEEERLVRQGYDFLDEKRMLLAAEIMRQLRKLEQLDGDLKERLAEASTALGAAIVDHGLEELQLMPVFGRIADPELTRRDFLGVQLIEAEDDAAGDDTLPAGGSAQECAWTFKGMVPVLTQLAAATGNLLRLADEYSRTERRAKALENVLLPEISEGLKRIGEQLEAMEQEDAVRVRLAGRRK